MTEELRAKAARARLRRMWQELAWCALVAVILDIVVRGAIGQGRASGTNIALFLGLAVVVHFALRPAILRADPASYAWQHKRPWLLPYAIPAGALIVALTMRYW